MSDNWKPIDQVREYGNQTDFVETSEFPNEPIKNFMNNCNLTTCRYKANGKCTNEENGLSPSELLMYLSDGIGNTETLKKFGIEIDFSKFEDDGK